MVLSLQLCLMMSAPTALYVGLRTSADADCTCGHGDGKMCPMHHTVTSSKQTETCAFRRAAHPQIEAVATLLGPIAVLSAGVYVGHPMPFSSVTLASSRPLDAVSVPDGPPPRS